MKTLIFLLVIALTGCTTSGIGVNPSSKPIYELDGLKVKREQVWQLRDFEGGTIKNNHTMYWFNSYFTCIDFVKDSEKREALGLHIEEYGLNCGSTGRFGSAADVTNYYIYTDGVTDGDFYYIIPISTKAVKNNKDEWFTPMFTSKTALRIFQKQRHSKLEKIYPDSLYYAKRIKVERIE